MKSVWNIPDQYHGTDPKELEKLNNDKRIKPCPKCGYKLILYMPGDSPQPAWEYNRCKVCDYEIMIEL